MLHKELKTRLVFLLIDVCVLPQIKPIFVYAIFRVGYISKGYINKCEFLSC